MTESSPGLLSSANNIRLDKIERAIARMTEHFPCMKTQGCLFVRGKLSPADKEYAEQSIRLGHADAELCRACQFRHDISTIMSPPPAAVDLSALTPNEIKVIVSGQEIERDRNRKHGWDFSDDGRTIQLYGDVKRSSTPVID